MKKVRVDIGKKSYEVTVEMLGGSEAATKAPAPRVSKEPIQPNRPSEAAGPAGASAAHPAAAPGTVTSPLAGKIVEISVAIGDQVAAGAAVATIEAMKMNTYVHAPSAGRVAQIFARTADSVQEGSAILRIE